MTRPAALSGFPEYLPADRIVEQHVLDTVRRVFELHGFASVETRAVEPLEQMLRKGEIDKEVYVLRRLNAPAEEPDAGLGLHFDLTVPFARYVVQNAGHLDFPFRRYQVQKVWRGERPQEGRYREFTQADIDVVGRDTLAAHHEVEVALVMAEAFRALPMPPAVILVNNRKLVEGFLRGLGAADVPAALRALDKLDKVGAARVAELLVVEAGLSAPAAQTCLELAGIRTADTSFVDRVLSLGVEHPLLDEGVAELAAVVGAAAQRLPGAVVGRPEDRARPGLLHSHGLRDPTGRLRGLRLDLLRWPLRRPGQRWAHHLPGRRHLAGGVPADGRPARPAGWSAPPARCPRVCWWPSPTRPPAPGPSRSLIDCARAASRPRWPPARRSSASRSSTPTGAASRSSGSPTPTVPPARSRTSAPGEQVPADPATWNPPAADLHPRVERIVAEQEETPA